MSMSHSDREHMRTHRSDVDRLVAVAAANGRVISPRQAYRAWRDVSERSAAGWLILDDDDEYLWAEVHGAVNDLVAA